MKHTRLKEDLLSENLVYESPMKKKKSDYIYKPKKRSVWDVIGHSYDKTFSSNGMLISHNEFNGLRPSETVADPVENFFAANPEEVNEFLSMARQNPENQRKTDIELVRQAMQDYNTRPIFRALRFFGAPDRVKLNEVYAPASVIMWRVAKNFFGQQDNVSPVRRGWNILTGFIIPYHPIKNLIVGILKTVRSIVKLPTQFLSCAIADVADYFAQENKVKAGENPENNFPALKFNAWKATSLIAWGFELTYESALEPVKAIKNSWKFGFEVAGPENPITGYALAFLFSGLRSLAFVALTVATFGVIAKFSGIDIASHVSTELAGQLANMPVIGTVSGWTTQALAYFGITLEANLAALPALVGLSALALTTLGTIADRFYDLWDYIWETPSTYKGGPSSLYSLEDEGYSPNIHTNNLYSTFQPDNDLKYNPESSLLSGDTRTTPSSTSYGQQGQGHSPKLQGNTARNQQEREEEARRLANTGTSGTTLRHSSDSES